MNIKNRKESEADENSTKISDGKWWFKIILICFFPADDKNFGKNKEEEEKKGSWIVYFIVGVDVNEWAREWFFLLWCESVNAKMKPHPYRSQAAKRQKWDRTMST